MHTGAIFLINKYACCAIYQNKKYFLFDSHARNTLGMPDTDGTSILLQFDDITELENYILQYTQYYHQNMFSITFIDIKLISKGAFKMALTRKKTIPTPTYTSKPIDSTQDNISENQNMMDNYFEYQKHCTFKKKEYMTEYMKKYRQQNKNLDKSKTSKQKKKEQLTNSIERQDIVKNSKMKKNYKTSQKRKSEIDELQLEKEKRTKKLKWQDDKENDKKAKQDKKIDKSKTSKEQKKKQLKNSIDKQDIVNNSKMKKSYKTSKKRKRETDELQLEKQKRTKQTKRHDDQFRKHNQQQITVKKYGRNINESIILFQNTVKDGPSYVCTCCHQTWFKHSMTPEDKWPKKIDHQILHEHITNYKSKDDKQWLCHTCINNLKEKRTPKLSFKNKTCFPPKIDVLDLQVLEERLIALRIPFMQIRELPRGSQLSMKGAVVNVPTDVQTTVNSLPRTQSMMETIPIKLKRRLVYKTSTCTQNVRPARVIKALQYLLENSDLYKDANITIDDTWKDTFTTEKSLSEDQQNMIDSHANLQNNENIRQDENNNDVEPNDSEHNIKQVNNDDSEDDGFEEKENEPEGNVDTLLDDIDFSTSNILSFAPGEGQRPLSFYKDQDAEYMSFPCIFSGQKRATNSERSVPVHYSDICKYELRSIDRRAALNIPNLFFKMKRLQIKYISDKVQVAMKRCKYKHKKYKVRDILDENTFNELTRLDEGYRIFRTIRGSPPYFEQKKRDVFAMIRQLGLPTWFMSLSAADTHWNDLLKCLSTLIDNKKLTDEEVLELDWSQKTRLVQCDPVTCVRYFDHRVHVFINNILRSPHEPIGKVTDYFYRVEFQQRGSPHIHMIVWIDQAPVFDVDNDEQVSQFIDKYTSCSTSVLPEMMKYVDLQRHKHSKSCRKGQMPICRFGFPHPPMSRTRILRSKLSASEDNEPNKTYESIIQKLNDMKDGENITFEQFLIELNMSEEDYIECIEKSLTTSTIYLKRSPSEIRINPYMKHLLDAWKANHDMQYIMDPYACAMYIVAYMSKSQRGMSQLLHKACEETKKGNMTLKESVRHMGNKFLNSVEISAQEAAYLVLQLPLTNCTRSVIFLNTSHPDERTFMLKDQETLEEMPKESTDIACGNTITRYSQRPKQLRDWCLADFASKINVTYPRAFKTDPFAENNEDNEVENEDSYDIHNDKEVESEDNDIHNDNNQNDTVHFVMQNGITYKERTNPRVIRYVKFSKTTDLENFCRERLMLFHPWKNEENDLLGTFDNYTDHYMSLKDILETKVLQYEHNAEELEIAQQRVENEDLDFAHIAPSNVQQEDDDQSVEPTESETYKFFNPERHVNQRQIDIAADIGLTPSMDRMETDILPGRLPDDIYFRHLRSFNPKQQQIYKHVIKWIKTKSEQLNLFYLQCSRASNIRNLSFIILL